jgi:hypothetical protein
LVIDNRFNLNVDAICDNDGQLHIHRIVQEVSCNNLIIDRDQMEVVQEEVVRKEVLEIEIKYSNYEQPNYGHSACTLWSFC